jgi:DNA-binding transcriptional regulator YiaG
LARDLESEGLQRRSWEIPGERQAREHADYGRARMVQQRESEPLYEYRLPCGRNFHSDTQEDANFPCRCPEEWHATAETIRQPADDLAAAIRLDEQRHRDRATDVLTHVRRGNFAPVKETRKRTGASDEVIRQVARQLGLSDPIRKGERNGNSKLSDCDVVTIRESTESGPKLATRYPVTAQQISKIRTGKNRADATCDCERHKLA